MSPLPSSNVMNLLIVLDSEPLKIPNIATTPPTTLYIPYSSTPNTSNTTLEVYSDTLIVRSIRKYNSKVFFAIREVEDVSGIYNLLISSSERFVAFLISATNIPISLRFLAIAILSSCLPFFSALEIKVFSVLMMSQNLS